MYDELIAELRQHHCDAKEDDTQEVCEECAYDVIIADESVPSGIASVCVCGLMNRAADAIEELSRENESLAKSVNEASEILQKRWIPVTERLPNAERKSYWGCTDNGYQCECRQFGIIEEKNRRIDRVGLYNRNAEKSAAMYEALAGISPEPPKEES